MSDKRICLICGKDIRRKRGDAKTCGVTCRNALDRRLENIEREIARALSTFRILDANQHQAAINAAFAVLEDKPYMRDFFAESGLTYKSGKALLDTLNAVHLTLYRVQPDDLLRLIAFLTSVDQPSFEQKTQVKILLQIQALHSRITAIDPMQEQFFQLFSKV